MCPLETAFATEPSDVSGYQASLSSDQRTAEPEVAILLATYQGQKYLTDQLNSFAAQSHANWRVWVSDDHSSDRTQPLLEHYERLWPAGRLSLHNGPAEGFAANFP